MKNSSGVMCRKNIAYEIMEAAERAGHLGYVCENILPKEFYDYIMGETYTCDKIALDDVLGGDFLMLHEVMEISELKKKGVRINGMTSMICDRAVIYEAHLTATGYEIKYAFSRGDLAWIKLRLSHAREWLKDENLPESLVERLKSIISEVLRPIAGVE